jgi:DNA-binding transcriptional regulator YhcF (GntR family)
MNPMFKEIINSVSKAIREGDGSNEDRLETIRDFSKICDLSSDEYEVMDNLINASLDKQQSI